MASSLLPLLLLNLLMLTKPSDFFTSRVTPADMMTLSWSVESDLDALPRKSVPSSLFNSDSSTEPPNTSSTPLSLKTDSSTSTSTSSSGATRTPQPSPSSTPTSTTAEPRTVFSEKFSAAAGEGVRGAPFK
ncbi:A-agglutinin anchorage subunit-like [Tupaia chinensis]|uniref:A-agglutinin anchorage subunit-like n=1 Tax=Tupaia chinensis TaxID=246437 RepID=UPI0003C8CC1B|nr:A-agglutinin anchorage subunit-like [Tupaia chinensis]